MNHVSLLQVRQLGYLLYNHFELQRTEQEVSSGISDQADPWNLWTQESGSLWQAPSNSSSPAKNTSSGAFLLGVDYQLYRDVRAGLFSGYLPSYTSLSGGLGSASTQGLTYGGTLSYGRPQGGFYADGVISGEGFRSSTSHPVVSHGKNYGTVSATPLSTAYTLGGDAGYDVRRGRWTYGPVAMVQYSQLQAGSISLNGPGNSYGTVNGQCLESLFTGFGSHLLYSLPVNRSVTLVPELRMFWSHEFLDGATTATGTLSQTPGRTYSATTSPGKQNAGNTYAGITALIGKHLSSSLFYGGTISSGENSVQTLILSVNLSF
jgi:outer membrane autotransporter protein